jgi:serine protein kinase
MGQNPTATPAAKTNRLTSLSKKYDVKKYKILNEEMGFEDYLNTCYENPQLGRNAFQKIYDMIMSHGTVDFERFRKKYRHHNFFDHAGKFPIFGLEPTLNELVNFFRSAAGHHGTQKRVLLLHGPVGSSKSTICDILKQGLEDYSLTDEGAWYSYKWVNLPTEGENAIYTQSTCDCPMHEDPLRLIPEEMRNGVMEDLTAKMLEKLPEAERAGQYRLRSEEGVCPLCREFMKRLLVVHDGDWAKVMENHIRVVRKQFSQFDRCGIGTFQPKDEKNQDSTELTGDIDYSRISKFGKDSDPRAFSFDGEFCIANRGICEFIEMLKLAKEFLYDLLGATQEHHIKPKKFSQIYIDEVLIAHTNNPEYEKLCSDQTMEALRDRTFKIDVPYLLRWQDEQKIYETDYGSDRISQHIAPHTLEIAAFFAVATRLKDDPDSKLTLIDKVKLYDGRSMPQWTEDSVKELMQKTPDEGMKIGVSARYIQDKISLALSKNPTYINFFMVLNEIKEGLTNSALITNKEEQSHYGECAELAIKELDNILKTEVQRALVADEDAIVRLCDRYIDNVMAYIDGVKITNPLTEKDEEPDERLMRSIESKIDVPEQAANDFRRMVQGFIGKLARKNEVFRWDSNEELKRALEKKVFEETKDTIKLSALSSATGVVDPDNQKKIDAIKTRLIKQFGYNEQSATDVLNYVSSIFARGEVE